MTKHISAKHPKWMHRGLVGYRCQTCGDTGDYWHFGFWCQRCYRRVIHGDHIWPLYSGSEREERIRLYTERAERGEDLFTGIKRRRLV